MEIEGATRKLIACNCIKQKILNRAISYHVTPNSHTDVK